MNIREWYEKDGAMMPGKGVALRKEEWEELKKHISFIDSSLTANKSEAFKGKRGRVGKKNACVDKGSLLLLVLLSPLRL